MKQFLLPAIGLFAILTIIACSKNLSIKLPQVYNIEQFRQPDMSDFDLIQKVVNDVPENSIIQFEKHRTYIIDHTVISFKSLTFKGPATLKRENQITYRLKENASSVSTYILLDHTSGLQVVDRLLLAIDSTYKGTTQINSVARISNDTVFLNNPLGNTVSSQSEFPIGTQIFKNINFFWILDPSGYPQKSCKFENLNFDGNRDNNKGSYTWLLNAAITALTKGPTYYRNCTFYNSPGESIVGHNADIRNCVFKNLNGSGFHTSADRIYNAEEEINSFLSNNLFENTNEIPTAITGHSEGCITHSNSGGYYTAINNNFINVGESVLGAIYPSLSANDWGTSNITFRDNIINTQGRMVWLIDVKTPGEIKNVIIQNNNIIDINTIDRSEELSIRQGIILENTKTE